VPTRPGPNRTAFFVTRPSSTGNDRDRVLAATDLVSLVAEQVRLEPKGTEFIGVCPFHDDSRPSMYVVPQKGFYHCFACGAHGNAIDFLMNLHKLEFREALETLASRAGLELTRGRRPEDAGRAGDRALLLRANRLAASFFRRMLAEEEIGAAGRAILADRGISAELAESFGLGIAPDAWSTLADKVQSANRDGLEVAGEPVPTPETFVSAGLVRTSSRGSLIDQFRNRLIFPIRDELGRPIAFGARKIDPEDEPKYLNSPESEVFHKGRTLYGLDLASRAIAKSRTAIVCEGYTDVIALHGHGFANAVATLGTALTREHAARLARFCDTVILLFDGDAAGRRAADRAVEVFFASEVDIRLCTLPDGLDPDELLRGEDGPARFQAALDAAPDALVSLLAEVRARLDEATGVTARQRIVDEVLRKLDGLGFEGVAGVRRSFVLEQLAGILGVSVSMLDRGTRRPAAPMSMPLPVEPSDGLPVEDPMVRPIERAALRRRTAEEALLRLVLADGELVTAKIDLGDGPRPVIDRFRPDDFLDDPCRIAWELVVRAVGEGLVPDGPDLVAEIDDRGLAALVSECFTLGYRALRAADADPAAMLADAVRDLHAAIERDARLSDRADLASRPVQSVEDAAAALQRLRAAGSDPAAITRRRGAHASRPVDQPGFDRPFPDQDPS